MIENEFWSFSKVIINSECLFPHMLTALFSNALLNLRESETEGNLFSVTLTSFVVFLKSITDLSITQNEEIPLMYQLIYEPFFSFY